MLKIDFRPADKILRRFGFFSVIGFGLMALILQLKFDAPGWLVWGLVGLGVCQGLAAALEFISVIRPIYVVMSGIGMAIGLVLGPLVLGLIFYGAFTPFALWFRLIGRDRLHRKWDAGAKSYWNERGESRKAASYLRLY